MSELMNNFELFIPSLYRYFSMELIGFSIAIGKIILIFTPLYIFFHFFAKIKNSLAFTDAQKNTINALEMYSAIVNFPFVIGIIVSFFDCVILFFKIGDPGMLIYALFIILYVFLICKILFMLVMYKKDALIYTRIFLITLPFAIVYLDYLLYPYGTLLDKIQNPFGHKQDYLTLFITICCFSAFYLSFFTFSSRIKAAWADPPPVLKEARADPHG